MSLETTLTGPPGPPGALDGIRVVDLTRVWAGPHATRIFADLGAEVIHVTSRKLAGELVVSAETARILGVYPDDDPGPRHWNRNSQTNDMARNKRDITLEFDTDAGLDLVRRLIAIADIVIENYSPRVMPKFGLDYANLAAINPRIILCSMPGYGSTGPHSSFISYGTNVDPASGLSSMMGYPGEEPHLCGNAYPDPVAGLFATGTILTALYHQRRTGHGQHIDMSQAEATTALLGEYALGFGLDGRLPERRGNGHPTHAPHGCFPCAGDDKWIAIAVQTEAQWSAFADALERPHWRHDERFATPGQRQKNQAALNDEIAAWCATRSPRVAMEMLQAAGVPAGIVANAEDLVTDPHHKARDFIWDIDHPEAGSLRYAGQPIRLSETPARLYRPAPCLGQHNEEILRGLLDLSAAAVDELRSGGLIGDTPLPRR